MNGIGPDRDRPTDMHADPEPVSVPPVFRQPGRVITYAARRAFRPAIIRHCGVRLAVDRDLLSPAIVDSLYRGGYEIAEADIIRRTLTSDDRVLEVGGGIGFIGTIAARIVRRPADVLIVEANPQLIPLMRRNFSLNGVSPTVRNAVLGRGDRVEVSFFLHRDVWASSLTAVHGARETKVRQEDVRRVFAEFRPTYVIVDIEGGEIDLFDDLPLDGIDNVCLEVHPARTGRAAIEGLFAALARQQFVRQGTSRRENVVFFRRHVGPAFRPCVTTRQGPTHARIAAAPTATTPTTFLEVRVCGLQRSGNHAVIQWILDQHQGKPACFLNNVRHGDHDPYATAEQASYYGFGSAPDANTVRAAAKHVLIYSYEDDLSKMRDGRRFLESVRDEAFEQNRERYLGSSRHRVDVIVLRDPFNFFASRLKKLGALTGVKDPDVIREDWKSLAADALHARQDATQATLFINYNRWFSDRAYRQQLSITLHGTLSDASLKLVSGLGGGSSFDAGRLSWRVIRARWRKLFDPRVYARVHHYWNKLFAPDGEQMKVLERWKALQDDISYQKIFADPELWHLSQRLFGELPGTRAFVARCCARYGTGSAPVGSVECSP